jgi:hypothetical protein
MNSAKASVRDPEEAVALYTREGFVFLELLGRSDSLPEARWARRLGPIALCSARHNSFFHNDRIANGIATELHADMKTFPSTVELRQPRAVLSHWLSERRQA